MHLIELRPAGTGRDSGSREIIYLFMHHSKYLNFTIWFFIQFQYNKLAACWWHNCKVFDVKDCKVLIKGYRSYSKQWGLWVDMELWIININRNDTDTGGEDTYRDTEAGPGRTQTSGRLCHIHQLGPATQPAIMPIPSTAVILLHCSYLFYIACRV